MDPRAIFAGLFLLASAALATAAEPQSGAWVPFAFALGLAVLALAGLAHHRGRRPPLRRLTGLTVVALVIAALSSIGEAELGGLGVLDLVALAAVLASVLVLAMPPRADAASVPGTPA